MKPSRAIFEEKILELRTNGWTAKQISSELNISFHTVYAWSRPKATTKKTQKKCPQCDKDFNSINKFCSNTCFFSFRNKNFYPNLNIDYFENIDSNEKAYWLGFLYADAHIYQKVGRSMWMDFVLSVKDEERIDAFLKNINLTADYKYYRKNGNSDQVGIRIGNQKFVNDLIKHGCIPRKRKKITFPLIDNKFDLPFILGYIDGDGSLSKNKSSLSITSGSKDFLLQVKEKLGITGSISTDNRGNICYNLYINVSARKKIYDSYLFSMPRKRP